MNLVFAVIDTNGECVAVVDTNLGGDVVFNVDDICEEFVVPFSSIENAVDCLRIVIRDMVRGDDNGEPA